MGQRIIRLLQWPYFLLIVVGVYILIQLPVYWLMPPSSDELAFQQAAAVGIEVKQQQAVGPLTAYARQYPNFGYGAFYWNYSQLCYHLVGSNSILLQRLLHLLLLAAIPLLLTYTALQLGQGRAVAQGLGLLWLCQPLAWHLTKLAGPEIPQLFLLVAGMVLLLAHSRWQWPAGALLLGLAFSLKLTALYIAPLVLLLFWVQRKNIPVLLLSLVGVGIGMVLGTPAMLLHWEDWAILMDYHSGLHPAFPAHFSAMWLQLPLRHTVLPLDIRPTGLLDIVPAVLLLIPLHAYITKRKERPWLIWAWWATALVAALAFVYVGRYAVWYWFPLAGVLPFVVLYLPPVTKMHLAWHIAWGILSLLTVCSFWM